VSNYGEIYENIRLYLRILIGFAYVVKQIMHYCKERCYLWWLQKTKEEEKKEKTNWYNCIV